MTVLMSGINMYSMALVMKVVLGWDIHFSIWASSLTVAVYVVLGGLRSAIFNEVLQFVLIWAGALLIPILSLIDAGGWSALQVRIAQNASAQYTHLWSTLGSFSGNPMGIHWTGIVPGLGWVISFGYCLPLMLARYCGAGLLGLGITALIAASCPEWRAT
jgi:SSS family solute:Na+ symporter